MSVWPILSPPLTIDMVPPRMMMIIMIQKGFTAISEMYLSLVLYSAAIPLLFHHDNCKNRKSKEMFKSTLHLQIVLLQYNITISILILCLHCLVDVYKRQMCSSYRSS